METTKNTPNPSHVIDFTNDSPTITFDAGSKVKLLRIFSYNDLDFSLRPDLCLVAKGDHGKVFSKAVATFIDKTNPDTYAVKPQKLVFTAANQWSLGITDVLQDPFKVGIEYELD